MHAADATTSPLPVTIDVALCIDREVYRRLRPILRHLCVGMIDYAVSGRLISPSPDVGRLSVGPIQMVPYDPPPWPMTHFRTSRIRRMGSLAERLAERPPTIVHAISAGSYELAGFLAERFDVDLILQLTAFRDVDALTPDLVERTALFIASSQPILDRLDEAVAVPAQQARLIRPGTLAGADPTCFADSDAIPSVLCADAFRPGCGVQQLIRATRILLDRKREFLTFLTGTGPLEGELRSLALSLDLSSSVIFAHPTGRTEQIMIGADIFVQPSVDTSMTAGPLHAMASGMPVVAVSGGVGDYFVDGITAVLVDDASPTALADGIESMLDDHRRARELAEGALSHVRTYHTISAMAEQTVSGYRTLLEQGRTYSMHE